MTREEVREQLKRIIELTSIIESDGAVWGMDTEVDNIDHLLDEAEKLIIPLKEYFVSEAREALKKIVDSSGYETVYDAALMRKQLAEEALAKLDSPK